MSTFTIDKLNRFKYVAENREKVTKSKIKAFGEELNEMKNTQLNKLTQKNRHIEQNTKLYIKKLETQQKEIDNSKVALEDLQKEKERNDKLEGDVEAILEHINPHQVLHLFDAFDIISTHFLKAYNYSEMINPINFLDIKEISSMFGSLRSTKSILQRTEQEAKDELKQRITIFKLDSTAIIDKYKQNIAAQKASQSRFDELNRLKLVKSKELNIVAIKVDAMRELERKVHLSHKEMTEKSVNLETIRQKRMTEENEYKSDFVTKCEINLRSVYSSIFLMCQYTVSISLRLFRDNAAILSHIKGLQEMLPKLTESNSKPCKLFSCFEGANTALVLQKIEKHLDCALSAEKFEELLVAHIKKSGKELNSFNQLVESIPQKIATITDAKLEAYNTLISELYNYIERCIAIRQKISQSTNYQMDNQAKLQAMQVVDVTNEEKAKIRLRKEKLKINKRLKSDKKSERGREVVDDLAEFIRDQRGFIKNNKMSETMDLKESKKEDAKEPSDIWFRKNLTKYCNFENNGTPFIRANVFI